MHFRFETHTNHIQGIPDTLLIIHNIALGDDLQDLSIHGNHHCPGCFQDPINILWSNFPGFPVSSGNCHHPARIDPVNMVSPYTSPAGMNFPAAHPFRRLNRGRY
jgi:hypothetical protein